MHFNVLRAKNKIKKGDKRTAQSSTVPISSYSFQNDQINLIKAVKDQIFYQ